MDAFFASVEVLDDPRLRGKPVVVGGASHRGVVAAASYEVRRFGVHSAMPMAEALRRCPEAIVVSPKRGRYEEVSSQVFEIFRRYTPVVEGLSLDEAFLDVTGSTALFGSPESIARRIKHEIEGELGLTASAGVSDCKFVAKIASDMDKPNGLTLVPDDKPSFLAPLPIERMWGVGPKTAPTLRALGLRTLGDLARADLAMLRRNLGDWGPQAQRLAQGNDDRPVVAESDAKSIGAESTYEQDLARTEDVERTLLAHASRVAERLTDEGLFASCVAIKLKFADFHLVSRQITLTEPVKDTASVYAAAIEAFRRSGWDGSPLRLTGVSARGLSDAQGTQRSLFEDPQKRRREKLEEVSAQLRARFDGLKLTRATLLDGNDDTPKVVVPEKERL
jgi:DNA polymerase IV